jgi:hypothetical protein
LNKLCEAVEPDNLDYSKVNEIIYFYPGQNVSGWSKPHEYVNTKGSVGTEKVSTSKGTIHLSLFDGGTSLFATVSGPGKNGACYYPWTGPEGLSTVVKSALKNTELYNGTKKSIGGYSLGSSGVRKALKDETFDYVYLGDVTPKADLNGKWDVFTYTPENWGSGAKPGGWYDKSLKQMLGVKKIPSEEENTSSTMRKHRKEFSHPSAENNHQSHMMTAIDSLLE